MENSSDTQLPVNTYKKRITRKTLLIWIGSFVLLVGAVVLTIYIIHRIQTINLVQSTLKNSASTMDKANGENGYPQHLPANAKSNKDVLIQGGGSFDGTSYCIFGRSNNDKSIVFHISSGDKQPQNGICPVSSVATKPGSVTEIEATLISSGQLGYTWDSVDGGASYTLQCATDKEFKDIASSSMKASNTRDCKNLKAGTNYFIRIRANNAAGAGPWSSVLNASTTSLSIAPTGLTLRPISPTSVEYTWGSVGGATLYEVEWSSDVNFIKDVYRVSQASVSGVSKNLTPGKVYWYHVKAVTADFDIEHAAFSPPISITTPTK